jgi:uncharacterized protein YidB (DUF937 family)
MGLLDSLVGAIGGGGQNGGGAELIAALLQQVGGQQGLAGLVEQFSRGGLGELVQSWVGTGQNLPISPEQIAQVLGDGPLAQLAQQFGVQPAQMASQLSSQLPGLVDQLTPQGQLPTQGMDELLGSLSGLLKG